jgi:aspartate/methionine/tyrosine aminotransferase
MRVMSERISRRIGAITESATLAVDAKAKALQAAGEPVIGFGAGEPDFPTPAHIVEAAVAACRNPKYHRYSPAAGLPELREAIAVKTERDSGFVTTAANVLVTNGGKHAVYNTFEALLNPGDEVLVPAPYWTTYPEPITLAGATPVVIATDFASEFKVTVRNSTPPVRRAPRRCSSYRRPTRPAPSTRASRRSRSAVGPRPKDLAHHRRDLRTSRLRRSRVLVDRHIVPELGDRVVILNGVAKTYAMTGWRVGWMIGPPDLIKAATNLQSHSTSNVCNIAQAAALAAVSGDLTAVAEMRAAFDRRPPTDARAALRHRRRGLPRTRGRLLRVPLVRRRARAHLRGPQGDEHHELASILLDEVKVAVVPGEAFGAPGYFRLSFALGDDDLGEGITRIADFVGRK